MKFTDAIKDLGRARNDREALNAIRTEHGSSSARWLAEQLGISSRQARRYLAGDVRRPPASRAAAIRARANPARIAGNALRGAGALNVGDVKVTIKSPGPRQPSEGRRRIGTKAVTPAARRILDQAAERLDAGDTAGAERLMNEAVQTMYGTDAFEITDYADGIDVL